MSVIAASRGTQVRALARWLSFSVVAIYGTFAIAVGAAELWSSLTGMSSDRGAVVPFILHSIGGGIALTSGGLQFAADTARRSRAWHRIIGRTYAWSAWITSVVALWSAAAFDDSLATRLVLSGIAVTWFVVTTHAVTLARKRRLAEHRRWMIRSYAVALFFVTFEMWVALLITVMPTATGRPLGILLSCVANVIAAEWWLARRHSARGAIPDSRVRISSKS